MKENSRAFVVIKAAPSFTPGLSYPVATASSPLPLTPPLAPVCVCPAPPFPAAPTPALGNPDALEAAPGCLPVPIPQLCLLWDPDLAATMSPGVCIPVFPLSQPISFSLPGIWEEKPGQGSLSPCAWGKERMRGSVWPLPSIAEQRKFIWRNQERSRPVPATPFIPQVLVKCLLCAWHWA